MRRVGITICIWCWRTSQAGSLLRNELRIQYYLSVRQPKAQQPETNSGGNLCAIYSADEGRTARGNGEFIWLVLEVVPWWISSHKEFFQQERSKVVAASNKGREQKRGCGAAARRSINHTKSTMTAKNFELWKFVLVGRRHSRHSTSKKSHGKDHNVALGGILSRPRTVGRAERNITPKPR